MLMTSDQSLAYSAESTETPVRVSIANFTELFSDTLLPLAIDTYQRGFVWNGEKITQLYNDLVHFNKTQKTTFLPYYMGTILLHRKVGESAGSSFRYIIDGQQRLTALSVLSYVKDGQCPPGSGMEYSQKSIRQIRAAQRMFEALVKNNEDSLPDFERIQFTVIEVDAIDLAFVFFDTQNNRGVRLEATDLLKAHHLRAIRGADPDFIQRMCARKWEQVQRGKGILSPKKDDFAPALFSRYLWRARRWSASDFDSETHDTILEEFEKNAEPLARATEIPLFRSRNNRLGTSLHLNPAGHAEINTCSISLSSRAADLPFAIRQPIYKGASFFYYAEKYADLLRWMMYDETSSVELKRFREIYYGLVDGNSFYLKEIFLLCSLMYADLYADERIAEFALYLEHALGAVRIGQSQVKRKTAMIFLRDAKFNLLDVISSSFVPKQVIDHLKRYHSDDSKYLGDEVSLEDGVRGRYKAGVLKYFAVGEEASLSKKKYWLKAKLKEYYGES